MGDTNKKLPSCFGQFVISIIGSLATPGILLLDRPKHSCSWFQSPQNIWNLWVGSIVDNDPIYKIINVSNKYLNVALFAHPTLVCLPWSYSIAEFKKKINKPINPKKMQKSWSTQVHMYNLCCPSFPTDEKPPSGLQMCGELGINRNEDVPAMSDHRQTLRNMNMIHHPMIWANDNISLTWIMTIWGWFPES